MKTLSKSTTWPFIVLALTVALSLVAAGCGDSSAVDGTLITVGPTTSGSLPIETTTEAGASTTETPGPTTTLAAASTPKTEKLGTSSESRLSNGHIRACGRITRVWMDGTTRKLEIDYVDYLTGAAADAAAIADGESSAPGGYWVSNKSTKLRTFTVSSSVKITTYSRDGNVGTVDPPCSWNDFYNLWHHVGEPAPDDINISDGVGFWWIERDPSTNVILKITEQFVS